jgi:uncharacterized protein (TIGR02270 family)
MVKLRVKFIPDILEEHYEALEFLWGQRETALRSPVCTSRALFDLDERIEAHVQGLLIGGEETIPIVEPGLSDGDSTTAFAASHILLRLNRSYAAQQVMDAFMAAQGSQLDGIRQALSHGPLDLIVDQLREAFPSAPAPIAVAAAEALAFHRQLEPNASRLGTLLRDENQMVRWAAWRVVALLPSTSLLEASVLDSFKTHEAVIHDEDQTVRREAMQAAVWTRQQWLLEHCRKLSNNPLPENGDAIYLLAILGKPTDLQQIVAAAKAGELGPRRFQALGAFGHPAVIGTLLEEIESDDPHVAVAAGTAFTKITGADINSHKRVQLPPGDSHEPDEFEREFLNEVILPSAELARAHWKKLQAAFSKGTRWCRGFDLSRGATNGILAQLDLESRWETCLRGKFEGTWHGSLIDLEAFPQKPLTENSQ